MDKIFNLIIFMLCVLSFCAYSEVDPEEFLMSTTPSLEKSDLEFKETHRKSDSLGPRPEKGVKNSSGKIDPPKELLSPKEMGKPSASEETHRSRDPMDYREKGKDNEYVY